MNEAETRAEVIAPVLKASGVVEGSGIPREYSITGLMVMGIPEPTIVPHLEWSFSR